MTLLSQREAATLLHLSERTLERWRTSGIGGPKFVRLGRSICYRLADIEAFIASRVVGSTSERHSAFASATEAQLRAYPDHRYLLRGGWEDK